MRCSPRRRCLVRWGRRGLLVGAAVLYGVVVAMAPLVWGHEGPDPSNGIDRWSRVVFGPDLTHALNSLDLGVAADWSLRPLVDLGSPRDVIAMILFLGLLCLLLRDWLGLALSVLGPLAATIVTEDALKPLVHRTRDGAFQYPSGHCTGAASVAAVAVLLLHRHGGWRAVAAAGWIFILPPLLVFVLVQRVHMHDLLDSIAGLAVGVATALVVAATLSGVTGRRHADSKDPTSLNTLLTSEA